MRRRAITPRGSGRAAQKEAEEEAGRRAGGAAQAHEANPFGYSDDSDIEIERRDKLFKAPKGWCRTPAQGMLVGLLGLISFAMLLAVHQLALLSALRGTRFGPDQPRLVKGYAARERTTHLQCQTFGAHSKRLDQGWRQRESRGERTGRESTFPFSWSLSTTPAEDGVSNEIDHLLSSSEQIVGDAEQADDIANPTVVLLTTLQTTESQLRSQLLQIVQTISARSPVVIGIRRTHLMERLLRDDMTAMKRMVAAVFPSPEFSVSVCASHHQHEAWRDIWNEHYVFGHFVLFDRVDTVHKNWRTWLNTTFHEYAREHPHDVRDQSVSPIDETPPPSSLANAMVFSLGPMPPNAGVLRSRPQGAVSSTPGGFVAIFPPLDVWEEFLRWFDDERNAQWRRPAGPEKHMSHFERHAVDHAGWAKPFARFLWYREIPTLYASPTYAYAMVPM